MTISFVKKLGLGTLILFSALPAFIAHGAEDVLVPLAEDKCPVCGMFVKKYPDWLAVIAFKDGSAAFFDGAKDLFKYYFNLEKYAPKKKKGDITAIQVTEYYGLERIIVQDAYFVIGSDTYGPMGKELIPFGTKEDAEQFLQDHKGKKILRFEEINPAVIEQLD